MDSECSQLPPCSVRQCSRPTYMHLRSCEYESLWFQGISTRCSYPMSPKQRKCGLALLRWLDSLRYLRGDWQTRPYHRYSWPVDPPDSHGADALSGSQTPLQG